MAAFETGFISPDSHVIMTSPPGSSFNEAANMYDTGAGSENTLDQEGVNDSTFNEIRFLFSTLAALLPDGYQVNEIEFKRTTSHATGGVVFTMRLYNVATVVSAINSAFNDPSTFPTVVTNTESLTAWSNPLSGVSFGDASFAIGFLLSGGGGSSQCRIHDIQFNFKGTVPDEEPTETELSHQSTSVIDGGTALRVVFANVSPPPLVEEPAPIEYRGGLPSLSSGSVLVPIEAPTFFQTAHLWGLVVVFPIDVAPDFDFTVSYDAEMLVWYTPEINTIFVSAAVTDQAVSWSVPSEQNRPRNTFRRVYDLMSVRNPSIPAGQSRRHLYGGQA